LSSDAFLKLSPCQLDKKVLGAFSRFLRPKTKLFAVKFRRILEVICLQGLQKKVPGAMSRYMFPKMKLVPVKLAASWSCRLFKVYTKSSGSIFLIFASKNEAVYCEVQTQF